MTGIQLPPDLELMCSDGPVLDVFSHRPCLVTEDVLGQVRTRLDALAADPRAAGYVPSKTPRGWKPGTSGVVLEALDAWLCLAGGTGGIRAGVLRSPHSLLFAPFQEETTAVSPRPDDWITQITDYQPPGYYLLALEPDDASARRDTLELARAAAAVFEPIEALRPRLDAVLALYDAHLDGDLSVADRTGTRHRLPRAWAAAAPGHGRILGGEVPRVHHLVADPGAHRRAGPGLPHLAGHGDALHRDRQGASFRGGRPGSLRPSRHQVPARGPAPTRG